MTGKDSKQPQARDALSGLQDQLGRLFAAERRLRGREQLREKGELSLAHGRVLFALGGDGERTAGQVAEGARMSAASVSGLLDDLEGAGALTRRRARSDRRRVLVSLTPEGKELLSQRQRLWEARFAAGVEAFSAEELMVATAVIGRVAELLDEV